MPVVATPSAAAAAPDSVALRVTLTSCESADPGSFTTDPKSLTIKFSCHDKEYKLGRDSRVLVDVRQAQLGDLAAVIKMRSGKIRRLVHGHVTWLGRFLFCSPVFGFFFQVDIAVEDADIRVPLRRANEPGTKAIVGLQIRFLR